MILRVLYSLLISVFYVVYDTFTMLMGHMLGGKRENPPAAPTLGDRAVNVSQSKLVRSQHEVSGPDAPTTQLGRSTTGISSSTGNELETAPASAAATQKTATPPGTPGVTPQLVRRYKQTRPREHSNSPESCHKPLQQHTRQPQQPGSSSEPGPGTSALAASSSQTREDTKSPACQIAGSKGTQAWTQDERMQRAWGPVQDKLQAQGIG